MPLRGSELEPPSALSMRETRRGIHMVSTNVCAALVAAAPVA